PAGRRAGSGLEPGDLRRAAHLRLEPSGVLEHAVDLRVARGVHLQLGVEAQEVLLEELDLHPAVSRLLGGGRRDQRLDESVAGQQLLAPTFGLRQAGGGGLWLGFRHGRFGPAPTAFST
ncbi:MAG: hypothetical protein ACK55I_18455, partial [bacterium]